MTAPILIIGGAGKTGRRVNELLQRQGLATRAVSIEPTDTRQLRDAHCRTRSCCGTQGEVLSSFATVTCYESSARAHVRLVW
jgi:nucleoside-diphosphate-sugar epimerase